MEFPSKDIVVFADLDDTLFQTIAKNVKGIHQATHSISAEKISYFTDAQLKLVELFLSNDQVEFIPVTARTMNQYQRTVFASDTRVRYASIYYGGMVLFNNQPILNQIITQNVRNFQIQQLLDLFSESLKKRLESVDVDGYYSIVSNLKIEEIKDLAFPQIGNFEFYTVKRGLVILPKGLRKASSVAWMIEKIKPTVTVGLGDSMADLEFLGLCNFKMVPEGGSIELVL